MSDAKTRQRWEARRKMIADEFFAGHEAVADAVLDALPYSAIPDWGDVALLMQSMDAAGLLASPEHDAAVAAKAANRVLAVIQDDLGGMRDTPNYAKTFDDALRFVRGYVSGAAINERVLPSTSGCSASSAKGVRPMQTPEEFAWEVLASDDFVLTPHEVLADLIRARDAEVAEQVRAETRYVVFDADWCEPPGDVIAVFATEAEAWAHIRGPGDGYGWSIVEVAAPPVGGERS